MKINRKNIIPLSAGITLAVVLSVVTVACSSASSQTTPPTTFATTAATGVISTSPTTTQTSQFQRRGANGTLASINGNTLTLTTSQGQATVIINSSTTIEKTVVGALSDIAQGDFVTVSGTPDSSGNINATSIMMLQGQPQTRVTPGSGSSTTRPSGTFPGRGTGSQLTIGSISAINGNAITVTTTQQSQVTVNIDSNTVIQKTVAGSVSDLQTGVTLSAIGPTDSNGAVDATSISIRLQGQGFPSTPTTASS
jgi:Domain of unknown function (DUF5666)